MTMSHRGTTPEVLPNADEASLTSQTDPQMFIRPHPQGIKCRSYFNQGSSESDHLIELQNSREEFSFPKLSWLDLQLAQPVVCSAATSCTVAPTLTPVSTWTLGQGPRKRSGSLSVPASPWRASPAGEQTASSPTQSVHKIGSELKR